MGQIVDAASIRERPAEADDRAVPGHWEGDLLSGANNTHIATLVERHTRFVMLLKVPSKDTATVVAALGKHVRKLPQELRRSLTWDRGKEMADHKNFTVATNVQVYFCDPRSPWQRGSNENTNGLLRQYFPRGTDLSRFSQAPRGRPWASKPLPIDYEQCCSDQLNPQHKADNVVAPIDVRFRGQTGKTYARSEPYRFLPQAVIRKHSLDLPTGLSHRPRAGSVV